jgi:hypothetical protein
MIKAPITGFARPVTDSVKRAKDYLKGRPDPGAIGPEPQPGEADWRPHGHQRR